jgi:Flp pilus assembly protein TadG
MRIGRRRVEKSEKGFSLLTTAVCTVVMIGTTGLAIDVGQMFIVKNELQAYADAAALAAAAKLDGTKQGVDNAQTAAQTGPMGSTIPNNVRFDSVTLPTSAIGTGYRQNVGDTNVDYKTASSSGNATYPYKYIQVTASDTITLFFIPIVGGLSNQFPISATAVAGQIGASNGVNGLAPFSPIAHNVNDTANFGFQKDAQYTLKWAGKNSTTCTADLNDPVTTNPPFVPNNLPPQHGYVDLNGGNNGNPNLRASIEYDSCLLCPLHVNDSIAGIPGNRSNGINPNVQNRSNQDPDQTSTTWTAYQAAGTGNHRRLITVPVHDQTGSGHGSGNATYNIIGFATFLLGPATDYNVGSGAFCATYVGPATTFDGGSPGPATTEYSLHLVQ